MTRYLYMAFAGIVYLIFFATFLYLIGFVGNVPYLPSTVDRNIAGPVATAIPVDLALIALFGLQHSVMARPGFKAVWTRIVPEPIERAIYVLAASLALMLLFALWRPIDGVVWQVDGPIGTYALWALFASGWLIVLLSTFMISHFELFGLTQVFLHWRNRRPAPPMLHFPLFYRLIRHPLYAGFFIAFWATPVMSYGHLLLAVGMSVFMLIAIPIEERDLIDMFGDEYVAYRGRVGGLVPRMWR